MLCGNCRHDFSDSMKNCPACGHPVPLAWDLLRTVLSPEDSLIKSFLESCGIPVILQPRESIGRLGLAVGPLAETLVLVPHEMLNEARQLLEAEPSPAEADTE